MSNPSRIPPARRSDLVLSPPGEDGGVVVKDPRRGTFFNLGPEETFLLLQLDGVQTVEAVCLAFEAKFGSLLTEEDLDGFVELARAQGFLRSGGQASVSAPPAPAPASTPAPAPAPAPAPPSPPQAAATTSEAATTWPRWLSPGRLLYWRQSFFDPDRFFNWLEPKIRFVWTGGFLAVTLVLIVAAGVVTWTSRGDLATDLPGALRWQTLAIAWVTLVLMTLCHEFGHGLTCKHYGGEVHEVGFLMIFFLPCFYCNVSDAWLMSRSKRLWIMLAGGYWDLCAWAVAVFVWRLTVPQALVHYVAYVVLTVCGGRIFFNLNPLMKLDGYYLLSDWMGIPNLRRRSWDLVLAHVRWLLWGGRRPGNEPKFYFLFAYGLASWLMSLAYVGLMLASMGLALGSRYGAAGLVPPAFLGVFLMRGLLKGFSGGEVGRMIRARHLRTAGWLLCLGSVPALLAVVEMEDRATGTFLVRSVVRGEVRAPVSAFLREVYFDEGEQVTPSVLVALLEIPDLDSKTAQKKAEVRETHARVRLLELGPRAEQLAQARARLEQATASLAVARRNLTSSRAAQKEDLARLDKQLAEEQAMAEYASYAYQRDLKLYAQDALPMEQLRDKRKNYEVSQAKLAQTLAQKKVRESQGTQEQETEVARQEKEQADARTALALLEAGTRPEEIEAERAKLARLQEELRFLQSQAERLSVKCPVSGLIVTPRLKEKVGQYLKEGDLICCVEDATGLEAEVILDEQEVPRIPEGAAVEMKARGYPFDTFRSTLTRLAPVAQRPEQAADPGRPTLPPKPDVPSTVAAYCRVEVAQGLRPGMTGQARIGCGRKPVGLILVEKALRLVRTDYWW